MHCIYMFYICIYKTVMCVLCIRPACDAYERQQWMTQLQLSARRYSEGSAKVTQKITVHTHTLCLSVSVSQSLCLFLTPRFPFPLHFGKLRQQSCDLKVRLGISLCWKWNNFVSFLSKISVSLSVLRKVVLDSTVFVRDKELVASHVKK